MIDELLKAGSAITLFSTDGQQITATVLDSNALGILINATVPRYGGETEDQRRFFPWASVRFVIG
jgi:hypothetical protein